ncbi:MAG: guanylate kinase [Candidatus Saccharibacteria bacterium]|nr:guanylate kinase [Candidatus Saccharibacteria bacterium]
MQGKLIFISGLTGSGKTTLVQKALESIENLEILLTYTTRPRRDGEKDSYEYVFVTDDEYIWMKSASLKWDETIFGEYKYASDANKYIEDLHNGVNVIVSVTPDLDDIQEMTDIYGVKPVSVWINTPKDVAMDRIKDDPRRVGRQEDEAVKDHFDILFDPIGVLEKDSESFIGLIRKITLT